MKTINDIHREIQDAMHSARQTHEYSAESASLEFVENMLTQMQVAGISRSELASCLGAKPAYITKILRGDTNFTLDTMVKIARVLGCEYRLHFQPKGAKSHWFDAYTPRETTSFRTTARHADSDVRGIFKHVEFKCLSFSADETNAAAA